MPPMSVLSMPPPPPPGGAPEPPSVPGSIPRLSLSKPQEKPAAPPAKGGLNIKVVAEPAIKVGAKPVVMPGKKGAVLRKRAALSPVMKAGVAIVIVAFAIGGVYTYRIFFPAPSRDVPIKSPVAKPVPKKDLAATAADSLNRIATGPGKLMDKAQNALTNRRNGEQAKVDAAITGLEEPTPTPTPATISIMADSQLTTDIKVNSTRLEAAPAANAEFRAFVANANIGGVFQGTPSRALVNGVIVREGQTVSAALGISFDRIDKVKKEIFFKDATGAEVSKSY